MRAIFRQAKADIFSRRLQSSLILLTIIAATTLLTLALTTLRSASGPFDRTFRALNGAHLWLHFDLEEVDEASLAQVRRLPLVAESTELCHQAWARAVLGEEKTGIFLHTMPPQPPAVSSLLITAGRYLQAGDSTGAVVDKNLAEHFGVRTGDTIQVITPQGKKGLTVVGLAVDVSWGPYPSWQPGQVHVLEETLADLVPDRSEWTTRLGLRLKDPEKIHEALQAVEALLPAKAVLDHIDWHFIRQAVQFMTQIFTILILTFGLFALLAAGFIIANTISGAVLAQFRQIGILKALGFTRVQVLLLFLAENLLLGLVGAVAGLLLGLILSPLALQPIARAFNASPSPQLDLVLAGVPLVTALLITLFSLWPAWQGSGVNTVQAIRFGFDLPRQKPSRLARIAAALRLPLVVVLGAKDAFARPVRAALTVFSLALGVIAVTFALGLNATIDAFVNDPSLRGIHYDVSVHREFLSDAEARRLIEERPEVESYFRGGSWPSLKVAGTDLTFLAWPLDGDLHRFDAVKQEGRWFQAEDEMMAGLGLLEWLGLQVGDNLSVVIHDKPAVFQIVGSYREMNNQGRMGLISLDTLRRYNPDAEVLVYFLELREGADPQAVKEALEMASDDGLGVEIVDQEPPSEVQQLQLTMLGLTAVLALIALVSVFNAAVMGVRERFRDFGTLKTVGLTPAQVMVTILAGTSALAVLAALIGIPAGIAFTQILLNAIARSVGFGSIPTSINWAWLALVVPGVVGIALLGSFLPSRWAAQVSIAEVLRYE